MTTTLASDENGDLFLGDDGNIAMLSGLPAVEQRCAEAARTRLSELVLQTDEGLPFLESVFTGSPNIATFENALRAALVAVDGVSAVTALTIGQAGAILNYAAEIDTVFGPGQVSG